MQRQEIKKMLNLWDKQFPGRLDVLFKSITNVAPSHLLDTGLFDFHGLEEERKAFMAANQDNRINVVSL